MAELKNTEMFDLPFKEDVNVVRGVDEAAGLVYVITNEGSYGGVSVDTVPLSELPSTSELLD